MKILVLSWRDPKHPLAGGAEQVMHEHMKGWVEAGHSVTFFSSQSHGVPANESLDGVNIIRRGSQYLLVHIYAFFWYLFGTHADFDLVVDQFHGWPFFTPLYVRKPKLAVIQETTREVWLKYPLPLGLNYILGPLGYLVEPVFFLFYKKVPFIVGSQSARKDLAKMGISGKNINVVPHGVIVKKPKGKIAKAETKTVVFLGALAKDKGVEDAIKTFGLLNKSDNYQFWIIGKGDANYIKYLKKMVENLKVDKNTKFWGFVSQQKKFEFLARAHIMLNPSIREGFGLVNIEANAMGTPVVAYRSQGLVDSVKEGVSGIFCEENTPESMAKGVEEVLADEVGLKNLAKSAVDWSKNFAWESSRAMSLKLVNEVGIVKK